MDHTPADPPAQSEARWNEAVRDKLLSRTCAWCGVEMAARKKGRGRQRKYCSEAHRQRAYEVRTARRRLERDQEAGRARADDEPVREVVKRTRTRTKVLANAPLHRRGIYPGDVYPDPTAQQQPTADTEGPVDPGQVQDLLLRAAAQIAQGQMPPQEAERLLISSGVLQAAAERFLHHR